MRYKFLPLHIRRTLAALTAREIRAAYGVTLGVADYLRTQARADHPACVVCGGHNTRVTHSVDGGELEYCEDCEIGMRRIRRTVASDEERMWAAEEMR